MQSTAPSIWSRLLLALPSRSRRCAGMRGQALHNYRDKNFDYFVAGDPRPAARGAHRVGARADGRRRRGGRRVCRFIASHAGGGHIVILRAVSDDSFDPDDGDYRRIVRRQVGPVVSAETIVFPLTARRRSIRASSRRCATADGIFLAGGDQGNYIRYWKGTPVQDALNAHVRADRPIGGSSAGLAILGHYSYTALDGGSMESKIALLDPLRFRGHAGRRFSASSLAGERDHRYAFLQALPARAV